MPSLQHASWDALEADISMTTGRARFRPIARRLTNERAQRDSHESRTPIGRSMQLFPELPQHGMEYENSQRARSHKCEGYERRKVHILRGSSNNILRGQAAGLTFHPKYTLYHCFYLAETTLNKPGFPQPSSVTLHLLNCITISFK